MDRGWTVSRVQIFGASAESAISRAAFISQKLFLESLCKSQFPHKSVNLSFILVNIKNKLTDLRGN